jgi:hypothetical protein
VAQKAPYSPNAGYNQPKAESVTAQHKVIAAGGGVANLKGQAGSVDVSSEQQQKS